MATKKTKTYEIDMCNGPILKKLLIFSFPLICSGILQLLFNAVDIIVVGQYVGEHALAAVGSTSSLISLFVSLFMGLSVGVNVLVAKYYGARDEKHLSDTLHTSVAISFISGFLLAVIGILFSPWILRLTKVPEEVLPLAAVYLRVYFAGMPVVMLYNFGAAILRAIGDTRRPLSYLTIAGILNVALNLFFVIVLNWSVLGVGLATTLSQVVSAFLVLRCLMKQTGGIRIEWKKISIHKKELKKILQIGLPAGFQSILFSLANVLIQSSINSFGAIVVAGNSAASNVGGFMQTALNAFAQATISFTGQNVGAKKFQRLNRILFVSLGCVIVLGTITAGLCRYAGPVLLRLYTDNPDAIQTGMIRLTYVGCFYVLAGIMEVLVGSIRGMGYAITPLIISLIGTCALRIGWLQTIFQMEQFHRIEMVYIIFPISWAITIVAHSISYIIMRRQLIKKHM